MLQQEAVLAYLKKNKRTGLTSMDAIEKFGCTRLSAVIFNLKRKGNDIRTVRESVPTRYGRSVSIARYFLK